MVELLGVSKRYGHAWAVREVSLKVEKGEFFSLLGPSGCGKTTTLRPVAGFERPDAGEVRIAGEAVGHLSPERRPIGMVFQNYALFPNMTVFGNVAFPLRLRRLPEERVRKRALELLEMGHLAGLEGRYPKELSGEQQRMALPRALAREPKLLLLDEPLSALDAKAEVGAQASPEGNGPHRHLRDPRPGGGPRPLRPGGGDAGGPPGAGGQPQGHLRPAQNPLRGSVRGLGHPGARGGPRRPFPPGPPLARPGGGGGTGVPPPAAGGPPGLPGGVFGGTGGALPLPGEPGAPVRNPSRAFPQVEAHA